MKNGTRRIAGSRNRFIRNGRIASGLSGPPRLNRTIATRRRRPDAGTSGPPPVTGEAEGRLSPTMKLRSNRPNSLPGTHDLQKCRDMLRRRLRHDAMAEVEDERPSAHRIQDALRL